jgi:RimJ/RimL family protein N-acetyltransferase
VIEVPELETERLVGRAGLFAPEAWPGLEVGWMVGRPRWGRGYAGEAARAAMEWAAAESRRASRSPSAS